jgi:hypothetical protein
MHSYYVFLALDVAQERVREAERIAWFRRAGRTQESRLAALGRRIGSAIFGRSMDLPVDRHIRASHPQH